MYSVIEQAAYDFSTLDKSHQEKLKNTTNLTIFLKYFPQPIDFHFFDCYHICRGNYKKELGAIQ